MFVALQLLFAIILVLIPTLLWSQTIVLEPVLTGLENPVYTTHAHDGSDRLFVVERAGRVKVLQQGTTVPTLFLDITTRVLAGGERGLLGLAFHPQFAVNRRFFVNYTRKPDGATVIAEYRTSTADGNVADIQETVLLVIEQPFANHNGGMIEFGPDDFLYIGMGDGGSGNDPQNRAQDVNDLLGKILRIDIDRPASASILYSSPPTNPFFGLTPGRDEIFALGLRNPWRFSFDSLTGDLYVGDVGQGVREEVNVVTLGGNYGWRVFEGTRCTNLDPTSCATSGFIPPIVEYSHSAGRCSITGGYVYRGGKQTLPSGTYMYGDFCTGEIFLWDGAEQRLLLDSDLSIASFGEDESGELYVVGLGGTLHRLTNPSPPSPTIQAAFESPAASEIVAGLALIRGWAFATQPGVGIEAVELFIDGRFYDDIPCCSERGDVRNSFPSFPPLQTLNSGWGLIINWGIFAAGSHTIQVRIKNTVGEVLSSDIRTVTVIKVGDSEFLDQFSLAGATASIDGEDLVIEEVLVRDKATQEQRRVHLRFRWQTSEQTLQTVQSVTAATLSSSLVTSFSRLLRQGRAILSPAVAQSAPGIQAVFESPVERQVASGVALIQGWAFTEDTASSLSEVRLLIDDQPSTLIPCCSARGDVRVAFPEQPNALLSGWGAVFNYGNLTEGFHTIGVRVSGSTGEVVTFRHGISVVRIGGFAFVDEFSLANATARIEGEEIVLSGVHVRDSASQQTRTITARLRWLQPAQALRIVASR